MSAFKTYATNFRTILDVLLNMHVQLQEFISKAFMACETKPISPNLLLQVQPNLEDISFNQGLFFRVNTNNCILMAGSHAAVEAAKHAVQSAFGHHEQKDTVMIPGHAGTVKFISKYKDDILRSIEMRHAVDIKTSEDFTEFYVTGNKHFVKNSEPDLCRLIDSVTRQTVYITDSSKVVLIRSSQEILENAGAAKHCLVCVNEVTEESDYLKDIMWSSMFIGKAVIEGNKLCTIWQGDITTFLDDAIVMYTNGDLESVGVASLTISTIGNQQNSICH